MCGDYTRDLNILYDTNALFFPGILRQLALRPDLILWGAVTHVFETISDIKDEASFLKARAQMRLLLEVSPTHFMPDADTVLRMGLWVVENSEPTLEWLRGAKMVAAAESLADLDLNMERAREMRRLQSEMFLVPMLEQMVRSINPAARFDNGVFNVRLDSTQLGDLKEFLYSEVGRRGVIESWFRREGWNQLNLPQWMWERAGELLDSFYLTYRGYVINMFANNWRPRGNDALDLDLTVSIGMSEWVLLTGDGRLLQACRTGGLPRDRFADIRTVDPERCWTKDA